LPPGNALVRVSTLVWHLLNTSDEAGSFPRELTVFPQAQLRVIPLVLLLHSSPEG